MSLSFQSQKSVAAHGLQAAHVHVPEVQPQGQGSMELGS